MEHLVTHDVYTNARTPAHLALMPNVVHCRYCLMCTQTWVHLFVCCVWEIKYVAFL
jgi:hypothetical protein